MKLHDPQPAATADDERARHEFVVERLEYVNKYIQFADTKAALILTGCSFLFALPLTRAEELAKLLRRTHGFTNPYFLVLVVFLQAALIFTVVHCAACIYPRIWGASNVAFPGIAGPARASDAQRKSRLAGFIAYVKQLQPAQTTEALAEHLFWISTIAVRKYVHVQRATIGLSLVLFGSITTAVALIWLAQQ